MDDIVTFRALPRTLVRVAVLSATALLPAFASGPHPATGGKECVSCHGSVLNAAVLHAPTREKQCELCHDVPAAGGKASLTDSLDKLCFTCHDKEKFSAKFVHGPVALGACVACHDPHGTANPRMLRARGKALCLTCHTDMQARLEAARFQHKAIDLGCTMCHSPHAAAAKYQLKATPPGLCATCHPAILQQATTAKTKHPPVTDERACLNCHDPHATDFRPQLRSDVMTTCLGCHNKKMTVRGVEIANMKELLAQNPDHHGPIREKYCAGCHRPHGSDNFRMLKAEYPAQFYAPYDPKNFSLCFGCHDSALPRDEHTATLTGFRKGDRNLHYVHVNKETKGRTCRACHETHASKNPKHIRDAVPFGQWQMPLNYTKTPTGGSCAPGCHELRSYDRTIQQAAR